MRHRRIGRKFGRNPHNQRALLRGLAAALFLTERDAEGEPNKPKVKGRIVTTLPKAKEVRPLVERCISIACRSLSALDAAERLETKAARGTDAWKAWRNSPQWQEWSQAMAPVVHARRRVVQLIGSKDAMRVLFDEIAPRFVDRPGGYTRILRLAKPRLGDNGDRAILEFSDRNPRPKRKRAARPSFESEQPVAEETAAESAGAPETAPAAETAPASEEASKE